MVMGLASEAGGGSPRETKLAPEVEEANEMGLTSEVDGASSKRKES